MSNYIREKLWNINIIVDEIKQFPQTYNTILQQSHKDGTCQMILRRKLNNLCKQGIIFKTSIPGTRFGKAIFYYMPKTYHILVEAGRVGSNVYCFFSYKKISRYHISVDEYWELLHGFWQKRRDKTIFSGNILKWI